MEIDSEDGDNLRGRSGGRSAEVSESVAALETRLKALASNSPTIVGGEAATSAGAAPAASETDSSSDPNLSSGNGRKKKDRKPKRSKTSGSMTLVPSLFHRLDRNPTVSFDYPEDIDFTRTFLRAAADMGQSACAAPGTGKRCEASTRAIQDLIGSCRKKRGKLKRSKPERNKREGEASPEVAKVQAKHLRFKISEKCHEYNCVRNAFARSGFTRVYDDDWHGFWGSTLPEELFRSMQPWQKANHFPGTWCLGRKDRMWRLISKMRRRHGEVYDITPRTFIISSSEERRKLRSTMDKKPTAIYILKPPNSSCGRGIKLLTGNSMTKKTKIAKNSVVQKYVSNPLLVNGRKFDLRLYVMVTSYDPLRIYLYNDGLTRFATVKYSTKSKSLKNTCIHLTNYSVNKKSSNFEFNTDAKADGVGSKWSYKALLRYLEGIGVDTAKLNRDICDLVIKTIIASESEVVSLCNRFFGNRFADGRSPAFECFGFDIIINSKLQPSLLEINVSPSLSAGTPLDRKIKNSLITDVFHTVGFCSFDTKKGMREIRKNSEARLFGKSEQSRVRNRFSLEQCSIDDLSIQELGVILEMEDEFARAATTDFQLIYPPLAESKRRYYDQFFEFRRVNNMIVDMWLKEREKRKNAHTRTSSRCKQQRSSSYSPSSSISSSSSTYDPTGRMGQSSVIRRSSGVDSGQTGGRSVVGNTEAEGKAFENSLSALDVAVAEQVRKQQSDRMYGNLQQGTANQGQAWGSGDGQALVSKQGYKHLHTALSPRKPAHVVKYAIPKSQTWKAGALSRFETGPSSFQNTYVINGTETDFRAQSQHQKRSLLISNSQRQARDRRPQQRYTHADTTYRSQSRGRSESVGNYTKVGETTPLQRRQQQPEQWKPPSWSRSGQRGDTSRTLGHLGAESLLPQVRGLDAIGKRTWAH